LSPEELNVGNENEVGMTCLLECTACDLNTYGLVQEKPDGDATHKELLFEYGEIHCLEHLKKDNKASLLHSKMAHNDKRENCPSNL